MDAGILTAAAVALTAVTGFLAELRRWIQPRRRGVDTSLPISPHDQAEQPQHKRTRNIDATAKNDKHAAGDPLDL